MVLQKIGSQAKYLDTEPSNGSEGELWKQFLYASLVSQSISETTSSNTRSFDVNGVSDAENATMRLTGVKSTASGSTSGSLSDGGSGDSVSVGGNNPPENAEVTLSGSISTDAQSSFGETDGGDVGPYVGGTLDPTNADISFTPKSGSQWTYNLNSGSDLGETAGNTDTVQIDVWDIDQINEVYVQFWGNDNNNDNSFEIKVDGVSFGTKDPIDYKYQDGSDSFKVAYGTFSGGSVDVSSKSTVDLTIVLPTDRDYSISGWDEYRNCEANAIQGPETGSVTVNHPGGSESVSASGSTAIDLSQGSNSVDLSMSGVGVDYDLSWTERSGIEDPSVNIGSSTVSYTGLLDGSYTETVDLSTGDYVIDATYSGVSTGLSYDLSWTEITTPQNPSIELDGGSSTLAEAGELSDGQTAEKSITLTTGTHSASISSNGEVKAEILWDEVQEETNPDFSNPDLQVLNQKLHVYYNGTWVPEQ